ncbi:HET domain containing protein [Tylopilus felleus]
MGTYCSRAPPDRPSEPTFVDDVDPAIKSLVCDACWNGVFSNDAWQTVLSAQTTPGQTGSSEGFAYKTTWAAIQAATDRDRCNWCRLFARPNTASSQGDVQVEIRAACDQDSDCTPAGEKMLSVKGHDGAGSFWERQYYMYTSPDDKAAKFVKARNRITDVSTPESYQLALECLNNCVCNHHEKCPPTEPARLPDRVIDCSDARKPKIVLTGGDQHGHFLALSYVWGGPQPLTLKENIDEYVKQGLDISKFPQTIQDAVLVTHSIGQRYLWIDALCIIQDSVEDKNRQLGRMREIYRHSYLTINVACAESSREGFLHRRRPQKVPDAQVPYRCPDGSVGSVWIAKQMDTDIADASHSYWDELEPINYRGWCLQEKLLPPRSLVYASDTLKYYCQTETVNIGHALCEPSTGMRLPNAIYRPPASSGDATLSEADHVVYRQAWLAVIFTYTLRNISVPSDKLVALAGVAEQFHLVYKDQYLAGLWRKTLLLDLLWKGEPAGGDLRARPAAYRAPSWSWASVDGLITVNYGEANLADDVHLRRADILDCRVTLASEQNPFGEVTKGVLKLKGVVIRVVLETRRVLLAVQSQEPIDIGSVSFDADEERPGDVYVVPLVWDPVSSFSVGIVVVTAGGDPSRYRRIGRFDSKADRRSKDNNWLASVSEQEIILV